MPVIQVGFEKAEEPEIKLPLDHRKIKRIPENHLFLLHCTKAFDCVDYNKLSKLWKVVKDRESWHATVHGVTKTGTLVSDWTISTWVWKSVHILQENWSNTTSNFVYSWKIFSPILLIYTILCLKHSLGDIIINPLFFFHSSFKFLLWSRVFPSNWLKLNISVILLYIHIYLYYFQVIKSSLGSN